MENTAVVRSPRALWRVLHSRFDVLSAQIETLQRDPRFDRVTIDTARAADEINIVHRQLAEFEASVRNELVSLNHRLDTVEEHVRRALGRIEHRQLDSAALPDSEFQVFSQDGEDGTLWHLSRLVPKAQRIFVEFGVEDYREANTRFLLTDGGWTGLVLDAESNNITRIRQSPLYWRYGLKAEQAWITRENVNQVIQAQGIAGEIGCLSIDIDGNDWWVWDALSAVDPIIVTIEYNWRFGPDRAVTVPYEPEFDRRRAHPSWLYFGTSLAALERLGERKGYALVATSSSGVNAFFVRQDRLPSDIPVRTASELWRPGRYSEFRDETDNLVKLSHDEQIALLATLPVIEME